MDNDLITYTAAKDAAKHNLLISLRQAIEDPAFDILSFASLLTQEEESEDWSNPLHSVFDRNLVRKARTYLAAASLLDSAMSTDEQPEPTGSHTEDVVYPEIED